MKLTITLKLTNDRGDTLEKTLERSITEYDDENAAEEACHDWGRVVAKLLLPMVKAERSE